MSEQTPLFVDTDGVYGADELGLPFRDLIGEGVVESTDLAVSQRSAGANMSVDVAAGACWIKGDSDDDLQPTYRCRNDATVNRTIDAADATNGRKDLVIARVNDSAFTGSQKGFSIEIVKGTAAASPSDPTVPDTAIVLARVNVAANASSIATADIDDLRVRAAVGAGMAAGAHVLDSTILGTDSSAITTSWANIISVSFTLTAPATTVRLRANCRLANTGANGGVAICALTESDGTPVGEAAVTDVGASQGASVTCEALLEDLAAGTYTYRLRAVKNGANGTLILKADQTYDSISVNGTALYAEAV